MRMTKQEFDAAVAAFENGAPEYMNEPHADAERRLFVAACELRRTNLSAPASLSTSPREWRSPPRKNRC
jgi:hypothetical protein